MAIGEIKLEFAGFWYGVEFTPSPNKHTLHMEHQSKIDCIVGVITNNNNISYNFTILTIVHASAHVMIVYGTFHTAIAS